MTTSTISSLVGNLWFYCPHCKTGQSPLDWGTNICKFEKCQKEYDVQFTFELSKSIIEQLILTKTKENKQSETVLMERIPVLHNFATGKRLVPSAPTWVKRNSEEHIRLQRELDRYRTSDIK